MLPSVEATSGSAERRGSAPTPRNVRRRHQAALDVRALVSYNVSSAALFTAFGHYMYERSASSARRRFETRSASSTLNKLDHSSTTTSPGGDGAALVVPPTLQMRGSQLDGIFMARGQRRVAL